MASISIGNGNRTVGLTSKARKKKKRSTTSAVKRTSIKANNTGNRISAKKKGCSGCSRSARNK